MPTSRTVADKHINVIPSRADWIRTSDLLTPRPSWQVAQTSIRRVFSALPRPRHVHGTHQVHEINPYLCQTVPGRDDVRWLGRSQERTCAGLFLGFDGQSDARSGAALVQKRNPEDQESQLRMKTGKAAWRWNGCEIWRQLRRFRTDAMRYPATIREWRHLRGRSTRCVVPAMRHPEACRVW
jgi:hypothetical protein